MAEHDLARVFQAVLDMVKLTKTITFISGRSPPPLPPIDSECLFQLKQNSKHLYLFNIPKKQAKTSELDFEVP